MDPSPCVDPRVERTRRVALEAVRELLVEVGLDRVSYEAVSERCGVARSTLYRHWPERAGLLVDAMSVLARPVEVAHTGDPIADLEAHVGNLAAVLGGEQSAVVLELAVAAGRDAALAEAHRDFVRRRRRPVIALARKAIEEGALRADLDAQFVVGQLVGPVFYAHLIQRTPWTETEARANARRVLAVLAASA